MADEEARAALYRIQQAQRVRAEREQARLLAGSPDAAKALTRRVHPAFPDTLVNTEGVIQMTDEKKQQAKQQQGEDVGQAEVQKQVDQEQDQGFVGVEADPTPNENYTLKGVTSGAPTPETDEETLRTAQRVLRGEVDR